MTLYRIEAVPTRKNQRVRLLGMCADKGRADAFAAMERNALGENWTVRIREQDNTPYPAPTLPEVPAQVWPAAHAPHTSWLPDEPLLPISPKRDKALEDEEEL